MIQQRRKEQDQLWVIDRLNDELRSVIEYDCVELFEEKVKEIYNHIESIDWKYSVEPDGYDILVISFDVVMRRQINVLKYLLVNEPGTMIVVFNDLYNDDDDWVDDEMVDIFFEIIMSDMDKYIEMIERDLNGALLEIFNYKMKLIKRSEILYQVC